MYSRGRIQGSQNEWETLWVFHFQPSQSSRSSGILWKTTRITAFPAQRRLAYPTKIKNRAWNTVGFYFSHTHARPAHFEMMENPDEYCTSSSLPSRKLTEKKNRAWNSEGNWTFLNGQKAIENHWLWSKFWKACRRWHNLRWQNVWETLWVLHFPTLPVTPRCWNSILNYQDYCVSSTTPTCVLTQNKKQA